MKDRFGRSASFHGFQPEHSSTISPLIQTMKSISKYRKSLFLTGLLLTLGLGGHPVGPLRHLPVSQAQPAPAGRVRSLTPSELEILNLKPELEAFIPEGMEQSTHPQDVRGRIGADDRVEMLSNRYPWSAIGRIVSEDANGETSAQSTKGWRVGRVRLG